MEVQTSGKPIDSVLERVLCMNILSSDYFKELDRLKTYHEVIDEIYNQVDHVEPWMTGNCRGPSTAFCLLYKFFTMKLSVKQMQGLLNHGDSPFIRAVGFLYLRYVGDSKSLWGWFEQYVTDDEEFSPGSNARVTTMGVYVRDLLLDQYYFDTLFPRIPVPVMRQIVSSLERMKISTQPAGVTGTGSRHSTDDTARRPPSVKAALSVSFGQRAPHRASTRDFSPVRRSVPRSREHQTSADDHRGSPHESKKYTKENNIDRDNNRSRNRERERGRDSDRSRDRSRESDRARERDRDEDRKRTKLVDRSWERSRDTARERLSDREWESNKERGREEWQDRDVDRYSNKVRNRVRDKERHGSWEKEREREHDDRSDSPGGTVNHNSGKASLNNLDKLRSVYGSGAEVGQSTDSHLRVKSKSDDDVICLGGPTWR